MRLLSISSIQRKRKTEEFTRLLLQKGIEPNNYELNRMLAEYFDVNTIGMPCYKPIKQKPYEESSKKDYNHNFKTLEEDLNTIYIANIEANNKAVAMQEYYDTEKNKVRNALTKLSLRVENIMDALKTTSHIKQYVQAFDDMYDIEFYGFSSRNIPYTTSFIDLLQKKLYTERTTNKSNKISMNAATIKINGLANFSGHTSKGTPQNILSDITNDVYAISATSPEDTEKQIEIIVDLGQLIEFNTVSFSYLSSRVMPCELLLSEDGENYIAVYDICNKDYVEWNFGLKKSRFVKIVCHKTEPDGLEESNSVPEYEYYFILKNVSVSKEEFETKSVFVSKPIEFSDLVSTIKLDATDMIFNNTRIDYFIGFDNDVDKVGWDAITNHQDYALSIFSKRHKILNYHVESFGEIGNEMSLYKLYKLPSNINRNSIKLTPAYNMWSVKRYVRNGKEQNDYSLTSGDFSSHIKDCTMLQLFMDCENYNRFSILTNALYVMTQFVSLEQSMNLFDKFIRVTEKDYKTDADGTQIKVFLNGYEVTANDNGKYSFALRKGVNKIQIAIYCADSSIEEKYLFHNVNFKALTNDVFGFVPMKYVNSATLDKMTTDTYQYYTIKDGYVYVKCNPEELIKSDINDMGYFISYSCLNEDMVGYFENNGIRFRVMAVLSSTDRNVSPELINFRITGR